MNHEHIIDLVAKVFEEREAKILETAERAGQVAAKQLLVDYQTGALRREIVALVRKEFDRVFCVHVDVKAEVRQSLDTLLPSNWCDPLLTGPSAVLGKPPYTGQDIERLIEAIRQRLLAASMETGGQ